MRGHLYVDVPLFGLAGVMAPWFPWGLGVAAGISAATHAWAVCDPSAQLYLAVRWYLPGCPDAVALTFDDGPDPEATPAILDALRTRGLKATFFPIGENAAAHPGLIRRIRDEGHALGLHTMRHPRSFPVLGPKRIRAELEDNGKALADITGEAPPALFRPPMGLKTPLVAWAIRNLGLTTVTWTTAARDAGSTDATAIHARASRGIRPGAILALHDGSEPRHPRSRDASVAALRSLAVDLETAGLGSRALRADRGRLLPAPEDGA